MAASGRTEVASDVKFGVEESFIVPYLWFKFGDPSSYRVHPNAHVVATATMATVTATEYAAYAINTFAKFVGLGR